MPVFDSPSFDHHEHVAFCHDAETGLKAVIAIHDTTLGPALGGCRMWVYENEQAAVEDALRLSRGMTYKSSLAGLDLGGGKSVIIGDAKKDKTPALMEAFGRAVDSLGGRYVAAEDVGMSVEDLVYARRATRHVAGIPEGGVGDPSPTTAKGVLHGIEAAVRHAMERDSLDGVRIAIQGLGHVGFLLAGLLHERGARLVVSDIDEMATKRAEKRFGAAAVKPDAVYGAEVDVFAPCALGAILNDRTIPALKARVIAGSANNQLAEDRHGEELRKRGILYAPDYAINAGGIIAISHEGEDNPQAAIDTHVARIRETLSRIFERAEREGRPTSEIADRMAEERVAAARSTPPQPKSQAAI